MPKPRFLDSLAQLGAHKRIAKEGNTHPMPDDLFIGCGIVSACSYLFDRGQPMRCFTAEATAVPKQDIVALRKERGAGGGDAVQLAAAETVRTTRQDVVGALEYRICLVRFKERRIRFARGYTRLCKRKRCSS